jgi:anti-sigma factor RsiW
MSEHVTDWIGAYHDGELRGARLRQVESHLRDCAACQAELDALSALSTLLQEESAMPPGTAPERFVAQVRLRTRPQAPPGLTRARKAGWLLLSGALGLWVFLQAILILSRLALLASSLFGGLPGAQSFEWFPGQFAIQLFVLDMVFTAALAALVWSWLAGWWVARPRPSPSASDIDG